MSKHTPGPWICHMPGYKALSPGVVPTMRNDPVPYCNVVEVDSLDKKSPEEIDANARLIAAAPAMYEALKWYVSVFSSDHLVHVQGADCMHCKGKDALAQAENKQ